MKIQLGTLRHRDSWGEDDSNVKSTSQATTTLKIGGTSQERKKKKKKKEKKPEVKAAGRRYKVGSLHVGGGESTSGWFSSGKGNSNWVELDIKKKDLKWYEGDDSSSKMRGEVLLVDSVKIVESDDMDHAFKILDGNKSYVFGADSDEEKYGWMKEIRKCLGIDSPRRESRSQSHAHRIMEIKSAIMYFEKNGMFGTKSEKRYVVLDKRTLRIHKGQKENSKLLSEVVLEDGAYKTRMRRGNTKNMKDGIEILREDGEGENIFQQQDWYEELLKVTNEWKEEENVFDEKKDEEEEQRVEIRPAAPSDVEDDTTTTTTTTTEPKDFFRNSLDDEAEGEDALDDW